MRIAAFNGYELHIPDTGGKAGKGCNLTGSVQIRQGNLIVRNIRYKRTVAGDQGRALDRARKWCEEHPVSASHRTQSAVPNVSNTPKRRN